VLSLQANGLNSNQRAVFITEAQIIAQDMADRIMAFGSIDSDTAAIAAGNAGNAVVTGSYGNGTLNLSKGGTVSSAVCSTGTPCATPAAILAYDGNEWLRALNDSSLPRASTDVSWLAATRIYTIEVRWDQERTGGTGNVTSCNPDNCFTMEVKL
jgi:type IV pilus assembly protein PilV